MRDTIKNFMSSLVLLNGKSPIIEFISTHHELNSTQKEGLIRLNLEHLMQKSQFVDQMGDFLPKHRRDLTAANLQVDSKFCVFSFV